MTIYPKVAGLLIIKRVDELTKKIKGKSEHSKQQTDGHIFFK